MTPPYNLVLSNVPGPLERQYLAGSELEMMAPLGLLSHGQGLFIAALTISGKMGIGFVGDRDSLPHLQHLAVYTGEALDELEKEVAPTSVRRLRAPRAPPSSSPFTQPQGTLMSAHPTTVAEAFLSTVARSGDRTALRWRNADDTWSSMTLTEFADRVARVAAGLQGLGV